MRPPDEISPPYRGYMPEYTDQDYYGDYEFQSSHASSDPRASDYQQPRKKHKIQPLLEPTAPNVFQVCIKFYNLTPYLQLTWNRHLLLFFKSVSFNYFKQTLALRLFPLNSFIIVIYYL